jgi:hypothetical protein
VGLLIANSEQTHKHPLVGLALFITCATPSKEGPAVVQIAKCELLPRNYPVAVEYRIDKMQGRDEIAILIRTVLSHRQQFEHNGMGIV